MVPPYYKINLMTRGNENWKISVTDEKLSIPALLPSPPPLLSFCVKGTQLSHVVQHNFSSYGTFRQVYISTSVEVYFTAISKTLSREKESIFLCYFRV